jgi:predicted RNA-binding Zn ribbon-like protein
VVRGRTPAVDDDELEAARALRLALHRVFSAIAEGRRPQRADLEALARDHASAAGAARLAPADDGAWRLTWPAAQPRAVRFAVTVDAMALLADPARLARVHRCPGPRAAGSSSTRAAGGGGARCRRAAVGSRCAGSTRAGGRPIAASNVSAR